MPMLKCGFRQYHENGEKHDDMGNYDGYSEQMDEFIGIQSMKLQKPYSQTTLKDLAGNSVKMSAETIEEIKNSNTYLGTKTKLATPWEKQQKEDAKDMEAITEEGPSMIVAVERPSCKSKLLVELLNRFNEAQGFDSILEHLAK